MDKRRTKVFRDKLLDRREGLVGQVQAAELYSRERDAEATQDPADMAANAYTKELLVSMSDNDRQLLNLIDEALERIETSGYGKVHSLRRSAAGETSRSSAVGATLCSLPGLAGAWASRRRRRLIAWRCDIIAASSNGEAAFVLPMSCYSCSSRVSTMRADSCLPAGVSGLWRECRSSAGFGVACRACWDKRASSPALRQSVGSVARSHSVATLRRRSTCRRRSMTTPKQRSGAIAATLNHLPRLARSVLRERFA